MDPKKAATVTNPDLTRAFEEGSGGAGKAPADTSPFKVYLQLLEKDSAEPPAFTEYPLADLEQAIDDLRAWMKLGPNHGAAIVIDTAPPVILSELHE